jgi:hypothetical protein
MASLLEREIVVLGPRTAGDAVELAVAADGGRVN